MYDLLVPPIKWHAICSTLDRGMLGVFSGLTADFFLAELTMRKAVLLIEDDEFIRGAMACLLELEGYEVREASDGEAGLALLATLPHPGIILLDWVMPVMNGLEFLETVQDDSILREVPVVVVSASVNDHQVKYLGAKACLKKGSELSKLIHTVDRYCLH